MLIRSEPKNVNQLADALDVHYRVAEHHIRILERNRIVTASGAKYGRLYFLSPEMEVHIHIFDEVWKKIQPAELEMKKD